VVRLSGGWGGLWWVCAVAIGRYVYTKSWSDIMYVCDDSECILNVALLHSI
jgi:hypothetical protein